jgi:hypothetical protein
MSAFPALLPVRTLHVNTALYVPAPPSPHTHTHLAQNLGQVSHCHMSSHTTQLSAYLFMPHLWEGGRETPLEALERVIHWGGSLLTVMNFQGLEKKISQPEVPESNLVRNVCANRNVPWVVVYNYMFPAKIQWWLYIPPSVTLPNSALCPHSLSVCFVLSRIWGCVWLIDGFWNTPYNLLLHFTNHYMTHYVFSSQSSSTAVSRDSLNSYSQLAWDPPYIALGRPNKKHRFLTIPL